MPYMIHRDQVYVVGITATDQKDYETKIDILREKLMDYDFVTDVMDYESGDDGDTSS